ncbi:hypothetical protein B0H14DRAFT_3895037 [Mycena olivaceomarginata]|nr:hypothetical protein B0H14DRAFT_3895037 [Mycena olivaceomarginata]
MRLRLSRSGREWGARHTGQGGSAAASRARRVDDLTSEEIVPAVPTPSPGADLSTALAAKAQVAFKFQGGRFLRLLVLCCLLSSSFSFHHLYPSHLHMPPLASASASPIRLVDFDFDYATLSSLDRHATDVGAPKVRCVVLARALGGGRRAGGSVARRQGRGRGRRGGGGKLLEGAPWVFDAIHNIPTKELPCCHERGTKIARFASTVYDPLARSVRLTAPAPPAPQRSPRRARREEFKKGKVGELGVLDERRVRILPGLGPLPAIFGLHIAMYGLSELAIQNRRKLFERMLRDLQAKEAERAATLVGRLPLDEDDVALLFEDVHRGRNVVPPHAVPVKPTVVRWDPGRALGVENVVVMEAGEAGVHESDGGEGGPGARGEDVREAVRRRVEEERFDMIYLEQGVG